MTKKKVVVTGIGAVSPIGTGKASFFEALLDGKTGFSKLPSWADDFPCNVAAAIPEFKAADWYKNKKEAKRQSRYMHLAIAASKLAVEDAKLEADQIGDRDRYGVLISSAVGGTDFYEDAGTKWEKHSEYCNTEKGEAFGGRNSVFAGPSEIEGAKFTFEGFKKISPFIVPSFILNSGSGVAAVELDARGPNYCVGGYGGEAAGAAVALMDAYRFISTDQTDIMVAGGSEACLTATAVAGFNKLPAMAKSVADSENANKAFDAASSGYVLGEGSGVLVLESEDHAKERGAKIYCELAAVGLAFGVERGDDEMGLNSMPTADAVASAIGNGLKAAGVSPEEVGFVAATGLGDKESDKTEAEGIRKAFGEHAMSVRVSSIKPQIGNSLAGAAALEAAVCCHALDAGVVPGTVGLDTPADGLDLNFVKGSKATVQDLKVAVTSSLGMGGTACSLVFKKYQP